MAVGRALAGRQAQASRRAGWLAGRRADEQAGPSDANYCIAPLRVWCNTGTEICAQVSREDGWWALRHAGTEEWRGESKNKNKKRGGGEREGPCPKRRLAGVKLQLLMQEGRKKKIKKKTPLHLFSLSVSAEENNSAAPGKRGGDRGILGAPQKPGGSRGDGGSSRPQQLLTLLPSLNAFHPLRNPAYLSTKLGTILCKIPFTTADLLLYSYLAGKKDTCLNKPIRRRQGKKFFTPCHHVALISKKQLETHTCYRFLRTKMKINSVA